jgi:uncharacterized delta-60 repeat protein
MGRLWLAMLALALLSVPAGAQASVGNFALAVQSDGRIVAAGGAGEIGPSPNREYAAVVRYLPNGRLDPSFGKGDGVVLIREQNPFTAIALQENGRVVLTSPGGAGGVTRLLPNGNLDRTFGSGGFLYGGASTSWQPTSVAVAESGRIFTAGMTGYLNDPGEHWYGWFYRITSNGRTGEVAGGMTDGEGDNPKTRINDFVLAPNGTAIAAGTVAERRLEAKSHVALARLTQDPIGGGFATEPDPSFGAGTGLVQPDFFPDSPFPEAANALAWSKDRLVVAGEANSNLLLARYTTDGLLDKSFRRRGFVTPTYGKFSDDRANAVAVGANGAIYAAGSSSFGCRRNCESLLLMRFRPNGLRELGFGEGGYVAPGVDTTLYGNPAQEVAYDIALRQGKVLVGGIVTREGSSRFFLRRYLADGSPDRTFGHRGRLATLPLAAERAR